MCLLLVMRTWALYHPYVVSPWLTNNLTYIVQSRGTGKKTTPKNRQWRYVSLRYFPRSLHPKILFKLLIFLSPTFLSIVDLPLLSLLECPQNTQWTEALIQGTVMNVTANIICKPPFQLFFAGHIIHFPAFGKQTSLSSYSRAVSRMLSQTGIGRGQYHASKNQRSNKVCSSGMR